MDDIGKRSQSQVLSNPKDFVSLKLGILIKQNQIFMTRAQNQIFMTRNISQILKFVTENLN